MRPRADRLEDCFLTELVEGSHLVVGFSGGADSTALLDYLWRQREVLSLSVEAVHLNHGLRDAESDRDQAFVEGFCRQRQIPLTVRRVNIAAAQQPGQSLETCGREARYRLFEEIACAWVGDDRPVKIATAHTLSDDVETILFHLARGTALDGLCGIPRQRGRIVRPLLGCTREQVEDYCRRQGLSFVTDSSNSDPVYRRNYIRACLVPAFGQLNPAFPESVLRMREALEQDRDCLDQLAVQWLGNCRREGGLALAPLREAPEAVRRRIALMLLEEWDLPREYSLVCTLTALMAEGKGRRELHPGCMAVVRRGILKMEQPVRVEVTPVTIQLSEIADGKSHGVRVEQLVFLDDLTCRQEKRLWLQVITSKDWENTKKIYENLLFFAVDYDTIIGSFQIRARQAGDQLALAGRNGSKTLKKLFSESGLSQLERQTRLVAADAQSVFWAEGFGADRRTVITSGRTSQILLGWSVDPAEVQFEQKGGKQDDS